jgi:hypothetical protein
VQRYKAILVVDLTNVSLNMLRGKKGQVWLLSVAAVCCCCLLLSLRLASCVGVAVCDRLACSVRDGV